MFNLYPHKYAGIAKINIHGHIVAKATMVVTRVIMSETSPNKLSDIAIIESNPSFALENSFWNCELSKFLRGMLLTIFTNFSLIFIFIFTSNADVIIPLA